MKAFTQPLHDLSEYDQIVSDLAGQRTPIHIDGCIDSQKCHLISSIGEPYPFKLIVTYNEIKAKENNSEKAIEAIVLQLHSAMAGWGCDADFIRELYTFMPPNI